MKSPIHTVNTMVGSTAPSVTDMKVSELKKLLADVPDDMEVVVSGGDHSYNYVGRGTGVIEVEYFPKYRHMAQYYDDENKNDPKNPVIEVFWIDDGRY